MGKIKPLYKINRVEFFDENDMLKGIMREESYPNHYVESIVKEEYQVLEWGGHYWVGYCYNSVPPFSRVQTYIAGEGCLFNVLHSRFDNNQEREEYVLNYQKQCPKAAWGFAAYFLAHTYTDEKGRVRCRLDGQGTDSNMLFEAYYQSQYEGYHAKAKDDYDYYQETHDQKGITELDKAFIKEHIQLEKGLLDRTKHEGALQAILQPILSYIDKYLSFVEAKQERTKVDAPVEMENNSKDELVSAPTVEELFAQAELEHPKEIKQLRVLLKGNLNLITQLYGKTPNDQARTIMEWAKQGLVYNPLENYKSAYARGLKALGVVNVCVQNFRNMFPRM